MCFIYENLFAREIHIIYKGKVIFLLFTIGKNTIIKVVGKQKGENKMKTLQQKIWEMLEDVSPLAAEEIAYELQIPLNIVQKELDLLITQNLIDCESGIYYANRRYLIDNLNKLNQDTRKVNEEAKKKFGKSRTEVR